MHKEFIDLLVSIGNAFQSCIKDYLLTDILPHVLPTKWDKLIQGNLVFFTYSHPWTIFI